jgi:hypothetical protein
MGLWVMVFNTTFNNISVISSFGSQFYWLGKPACPEKTTELLQATNKFLSQNVPST